VKWHSLIMIGILVVILLAAGCSEDAIPDVALPPADMVQPGQVLVTPGDVTGNGIAGGTIDTITFSVGLVPGEKPVDMEKISIVYADTIKTETLTPVEGFRGDPPRGYWGILGVTNEIGQPNNRLDDREQFVIRINPWAYLPPKRMVTIVVRTPSGTPLTFRRIAPPTILSENNILTPL
jgi:archaellin